MSHTLSILHYTLFISLIDNKIYFIMKPNSCNTLIIFKKFEKTNDLEWFVCLF